MNRENSSWNSKSRCEWMYKTQKNFCHWSSHLRLKVRMLDEIFSPSQNIQTQIKKIVCLFLAAPTMAVSAFVVSVKLKTHQLQSTWSNYSRLWKFHCWHSSPRDLFLVFLATLSLFVLLTIPFLSPHLSHLGTIELEVKLEFLIKGMAGILKNDFFSDQSWIYVWKTHFWTLHKLISYSEYHISRHPVYVYW